MEPIEVGERIKKYRKQLEITREQLSNGKISFSLLKQIEQGKRKVTPNKAAIIAAVLNEVAERKKIKFDISANDLLIPERDYADMVCKRRIEELDSVEFCLDYYMEILKIADSYNLQAIKYQVYQKISIYSFDNDINLSLLYSKKELSLYISLNYTDKLSDVLNKLGACYYNLKKYNLALQCFNHCYYNLKNYTGNVNIMRKKIFYNLALCSKKLGKNSEALFYIEKMFLPKNTDTTLDNMALILKANILLSLKRYEKALEVYTYIADQSFDYLYIIQNNMAEAFKKLNRVDDSIKYLTKSINNQINSPSPNTTFSLISIADNYKNQNMIRESIIFYEYALDNSIKFNQYNDTLLCYETLLNLYREIKRSDKIDSLYNNLNGFINNNVVPSEFLDKALLLVKKFKIK